MKKDLARRHIVRIDVGLIDMSEDEHAYVVGAYTERRRLAEVEGRSYHLTDFVHDALIEASHRVAVLP